jgi:hypothetical protein
MRALVLVLSGSGRNVCNRLRIDGSASTTALDGIADSGKRPDGLAAATPAEQHSSADDAVGILEVVHSGCVGAVELALHGCRIAPSMSPDGTPRLADCLRIRACRDGGSEPLGRSASHLDVRAELCSDRDVSRDLASICPRETSGLPAKRSSHHRWSEKCPVLLTSESPGLTVPHSPGKQEAVAAGSDACRSSAPESVRHDAAHFGIVGRIQLPRKSIDTALRRVCAHGSAHAPATAPTQEAGSPNERSGGS